MTSLELISPLPSPMPTHYPYHPAICTISLPAPSRCLCHLAACVISLSAPSHRLPPSMQKPAFPERLFHLFRESGLSSRLSTASCLCLILRRPGCAKSCADSLLQDAGRHGRACPAGLTSLSMPSPGRLFNFMCRLYLK